MHFVMGAFVVLVMVIAVQKPKVEQIKTGKEVKIGNHVYKCEEVK